MDFGEEKKIKPFNWQQAFPEVFPSTLKGGTKLSSGFDVVIGNPTYGPFFQKRRISIYGKNFLPPTINWTHISYSLNRLLSCAKNREI